MATKSQDRRKVRLSRALGVALTPKAARYLEKRPYAPGEHGRTKRKQDSDYAVRLREKQRLREQYGIREKQMRNTFNEARRTQGLTGENLVELLEMRLDALVLRSGFARTTAQARQLVVHRHILVDGQLVDRPSFRVKPGQTHPRQGQERGHRALPGRSRRRSRRRSAPGPGLRRGRARQAPGTSRASPQARRGPRRLRRPARRRVLRGSLMLICDPHEGRRGIPGALRRFRLRWRDAAPGGPARKW